MANEKGVFDLTRVQAMIGKEMGLTENEAFVAKCPVDASEIRRYALAVEDANPLYIDDEYARTTRWKGVIAPPTFVHTCGGASALVWVHVDGTDEWPHGNLFAGSDFEFYLPIRVGDKITPTSKITNVVEKVGKFVGPIAFVTAETSYRNHRGELVAIWRQTVGKYRTAEAQDKRSYTTEELGPLYPPGIPVPTKGELRTRGAKPLFYEDVSVGDLVPPLIRELTIPKIVTTTDVAVRAGIMLPHTLPGPGCYWHYSPGESWKMRGLPAPMDEGPIRPAQPAQLMTDWIGDEGCLSRLSVKIQRPIYAGDTTTWKAKVTDKYEKDGQHFVDCQIVGENQRGQISTEGSATVILPKSH